MQHAMNDAVLPAAVPGVRADVWLWAARFFKTRAIAKKAIEGGRIDVNDLSCKPSKSLHTGDRLVVGVGEQRFEVVIRGLSEKRGPAASAQTLYEETDASKLARELQREQRRLLNSDQAKPAKRPDKRARRLIRHFQAKE
jgi:ribosome-associated heat shock protein Hsp15